MAGPALRPTPSPEAWETGPEPSHAGRTPRVKRRQRTSCAESTRMRRAGMLESCDRYLNVFQP